MTNNIDINKLGSADLESYIKVLQAFQNFALGEDVFESGFNQNSGYIYIALENGIQIASCFGNDVEYIVTDFETGEESFLSTYQEALNII